MYRNLITCASATAPLYLLHYTVYRSLYKHWQWKCSGGGGGAFNVKKRDLEFFSIPSTCTQENSISLFHTVSFNPLLLWNPMENFVIKMCVPPKTTEIKHVLTSDIYKCIEYVMLWQVLCQTTLGSRHFISCILLQFLHVWGFCTDTVDSQTY